MDLGLLVLLVTLSGIFSGLNIGLLSLSTTELNLEKKLGNPHAAAILPLRRQRNFLISTLILGNVIVNAIIPLFLNSITTGVMAGAISVILITIFGEVLPQAICAKHAITVGGIFAPFVRLTMFATYPISKPLAWLLDAILGKEKYRYYSKRKMERFVELHTHESSNIDSDEIRIMKGSLTFSDKPVKNIMTPWDKVYAISENEVLDEELRSEIHKEGFSRIPVFHNNKNTIVGVLFTKDLIISKNNLTAKEVMRTDKVFSIEEDETLDDTLNFAIKKRLHIFIVKDENNRTIGLVTLEDILEEILKREIEDETD